MCGGYFFSKIPVSVSLHFSLKYTSTICQGFMVELSSECIWPWENFIRPGRSSHRCFFNKFVGRKACNFFKKKLQHRCFPVYIAKILRKSPCCTPVNIANCSRTPIFMNICERLFLTWAYLGPWQTSVMELFVEILNS